MTDRGEFVKRPITIEPCANGSYLVRWHVNSNDPDGLYVPMTASCIAFTDWRDLVGFLSEDYEVANASPAGPGDNSVKVDITKRFVEAMRDELKRQGKGDKLDIWTRDGNGGELKRYQVDGFIDLNALADVVIKLALDEGFAP